MHIDDPRLFKPGPFNLSHWAVTHRTLILFLMLLSLVAGTIAYLRLGRAEDPNFTVKVVTLTLQWPGATAAEMQDQITDRIEKKLRELPWFDIVRTYTRPGFAALQLQFKDATPPRLVPELFYQTRKKLDDLRPDLPAAMIGPFINDEYGDVDVLLYAVTSADAGHARLKAVAESLRLRLQNVPGAVKVNLYGEQDQRIFVEFSHAKLATLGIAPQQIFDSLARQNAVVPAGSVDTGAQRVPIRITGALDGAAAVAETPVEAGGRTFRLGDIAEVRHGYEDPPFTLARANGLDAVLVGVVMQRGHNVLELGRALEKALAEFRQEVPLGIEIEKVADQPEVVEHAVAEFTRSFVEALVIVLVVCFLTLGWRTGIVVAFSVPLVLALTFVIMLMMGFDLHRITLGALIISLGLLVDDATIQVEMMMVKMEQGWDRILAASYAWTSTAFPSLTGTIVTLVGFLPVGLAASSTGEYAGGIFWVVGISLIISWLVAVLFTPYLGWLLLAERKAGAGEAHEVDASALYDTRFYRLFRGLVTGCVTHRWAVILVTAGLFAGSVMVFGQVQQQFFPTSERPELFFQLRLPEGTAIATTDAAARAAEAMLAGDEDIDHFTTFVGEGPPRFWLGLNPALPNSAYAELVIVARDLEARERIKARLEREVAEGALPQARVRVDRFNFGPPVGFPVQFRVVGPDALEVRRIAYQVRAVMAANPNALDPHLDWNERQPAVTLEVDQERARALGFTPVEVAQALQTLLDGVTVTSVRLGTERAAVVARAVEAERLDLGRIADLTILARNGVPVPLAQVGRLSIGSEEPILWRRNRDLAITVRSDVLDGIQAPVVSGQVKAALASIEAELPPGYRIDMGGAIEEAAKGNGSLFILFPVMFLLMLTTLMIQLHSFSKLALIFLTGPLGIVGAAWALWLFGAPFGFVALLGLIALAGMIMRNAVILVDQIDANLASGMEMRGAVIEATVRRARPVVVTALTAVLAMIPLSSSLFWGPMAITIMGGLTGATFLTLLFLPALYAAWFRVPRRAPVAANSDLPADPLQMAAE